MTKQINAHRDLNEASAHCDAFVYVPAILKDAILNIIA